MKRRLNIFLREGLDMGRRVKLRDLGIPGDSDTAYKAPNKLYYSSKAAYDALLESEINRKKCIDALFDMLEYKKELRPPSYLYKKLKECESYGYDIVYETILDQAENIEWAIHNKEFNSEINKIAYIMSIVQNHLMDIYKQQKRAEAFRKRESSKIINIEEYQAKKQKNKDIGRWLDD